MVSPVNEPPASRFFGSSDDKKKQQAPLLANFDSTSTMAVDIVKPKGHKGDSCTSAIIWSAYVVFAIATLAPALGMDRTALGWFRFHPLLQTLAIGSFTYSIATLQPATARAHIKAAGLRRQQMARISAVPILLLGTLAIFATKHVRGASHFTSWHGTFGILSTAWIFGQALVGSSTLWFKGAAWGKKVRDLRKYHRFSGFLLLPMLWFTAHLGGWSTWVTSNIYPSMQLLAYSVAPLFILVGVYSRFRPSSKVRYI